MKKYRPSNGCEGMWFTEEYCMQCLHCDGDPDDENNPKAPPPPVPDNQLMLFPITDEILTKNKSILCTH